MKNLKKIFKEKKVLITGHTGFKGSWLTLWMNIMGAEVFGISKNYNTKPSHAKLLKFDKKIKQKFFNIQNKKKLKEVINSFKPDFIFHLAAQALVHESYDSPLNTWKTNTIGTINLLESIRDYKKKCVVIIITSDKCYKNFEIKRGYSENDVLGGDDPYSASKAAADIAIQSYTKSYFSMKDNNVRIAIARAGNVVGGGDWSERRLIPDCVKSWAKKQRVVLRSPNSTRPWQHVLEALAGYLFLAKNLKQNNKLHGQAFNFGPANKNNFKVIDVVKLMKKNWDNVSWKIEKNNKSFKESKLLKLNSSKAGKILGWKNILSFRNTVEHVSKWYNDFYNKKIDSMIISTKQIKDYEKKISRFL